MPRPSHTNLQNGESLAHSLERAEPIRFGPWSSFTGDTHFPDGVQPREMFEFHFCPGNLHNFPARQMSASQEIRLVIIGAEDHCGGASGAVVVASCKQVDSQWRALSDDGKQFVVGLNADPILTRLAQFFASIKGEWDVEITRIGNAGTGALRLSATHHHGEKEHSYKSVFHGEPPFRLAWVGC